MNTKVLNKKIAKECEISKKLAEASMITDGDHSFKIRDEQEKHWQKFQFFKKLEKAMNK